MKRIVLFQILPAVVGGLAIYFMPHAANPTHTLIILAEILGAVGALFVFGPLGAMQSEIVSGTSRQFAIPYFFGSFTGLLSTIWLPNWLSISLESALLVQTGLNIALSKAEQTTIVWNSETKAKFNRFFVIPFIVGMAAIVAMPSIDNPTPEQVQLAQWMGLAGAILIFIPLGLLQSGMVKGTSLWFAIPNFLGCAIGLVSCYWLPNWLTIALQGAIGTQTLVNMIHHHLLRKSE